MLQLITALTCFCKLAHIIMLLSQMNDHMRYLVVLDDVWDARLWTLLLTHNYLPDRRNRSRVIITTQMLSLAHEISTHCSFQMPYLEEDELYFVLFICLGRYGSCIN